uniref:Uncharacterized protein n=1 Tax=viral metagenome TaxID=1070528 RepID=A0A6M3LQ50_9ZZZZ
MVHVGDRVRVVRLLDEGDAVLNFTARRLGTEGTATSYEMGYFGITFDKPGLPGDFWDLFHETELEVISA